MLDSSDGDSSDGDSAARDSAAGDSVVAKYGVFYNLFALKLALITCHKKS